MKPSALLLGAAAGFLGGLLGIGGGTVIVPGFVLLLGLAQKKAQGTSLICACLIALAAVFPYTIHGSINYYYSIFIIIGGIIGATIGSGIVKKINTQLLRIIFVFVVAFAAAQMLYSGITGKGMLTGTGLLTVNYILYIKLFIVGIISGILSGLLGLGGGVVMVPCMLFLGIDQKLAQGISLLCILPNALTGIYHQSKWGNVDFPTGISAGIGAAVCSLPGSRCALALDSQPLHIIFSVFMFVVAGLMAQTAVKARREKTE